METKKKTIIDEYDFALKLYLQLDQGMARTKKIRIQIQIRKGREMGDHLPSYNHRVLQK